MESGKCFAQSEREKPLAEKTKIMFVTMHNVGYGKCHHDIKKHWQKIPLQLDSSQASSTWSDVSKAN